MKKLLLSFLFILAFCGISHAACTGSSPNWTTTSDQASVQTCVTNATAGDTITISAGSSTWTTHVTWSNKALTVQGPACTLNAAGQPTSCPVTITVNTATADAITADTCTAANYVTIGNMAFILQTGATFGTININCNDIGGQPIVNFRIHHIRMTGDAGGRWIVVTPYGVVDHSYFDGGANTGNISLFPDNGRSTSNAYHTPLTFGSNKALYIENCYFTNTLANGGNGVSDNYTGGYVVFRFNTVVNNNIGVHGWDSQNRGVLGVEMYGNTFIAESHIGSIDPFGPRSGTGYIFYNTMQNVQPMNAGEGFISFFTPRYYGALSPASLSGNASLNERADGYYPTMPWAVPPTAYSGTSGPVNDGLGNKVTGANKIDGNQKAAGHMDSDYTRTVTDLVTTSGSTTITSATASFVAGDLVKRIYGTNIKAGRTITDGVTHSNTTFDSATANFTTGDVGRLVGDDARHIPLGTYIASVSSTTQVVLTQAANNSQSSLVTFMPDCYLTSITNSTTAVMNCKANASGTGGTLTIGYTDEGYPLADQPGRGSFAIANSGNWPNVAGGYTDANYQSLSPWYLMGNNFQTVNGSLVVQTSENPIPTYVGLDGGQAYMKINREWFEPLTTTSYVQTNSSTPFNGTAGTGIGTHANRPATCTPGAIGGDNPGYWEVDTGSWNTSGLTVTYPNGGSAYSQGRLYTCTLPDTWTLTYTPYTFPYPGTADAGGGGGSVTAAARGRARR